MKTYATLFSEKRQGAFTRAGAFIRINTVTIACQLNCARFLKKQMNVHMMTAFAHSINNQNLFGKILFVLLIKAFDTSFIQIVNIEEGVLR